MVDACFAVFKSTMEAQDYSIEEGYTEFKD